MKSNVAVKRSLVKSMTFRTLVLVADVVVIYLVTRRWDTTVGLTVATNAASTILYYLHERVWNRIQWGRSVHGEPSGPAPL